MILEAKSSPPELDDLVDDGVVEAFSNCGTAQQVESQLLQVAATGISVDGQRVETHHREHRCVVDVLE